MSVIIASTHRPAYVIVEKDYQRRKFNMSHIKNGIQKDMTPIVFEDLHSAKYFAEVLSVAISRTSEWDNAIELQDDDLVVASEYKNYMAEDGIDYEYCIVIELEE